MKWRPDGGHRSGGTIASVRNPLSGFAFTLFGALGLSFLVCVPILFLPQPELVYFYLPFALFGVGMFSGRTTFLGTLGLVGGLLGGFGGIFAFQAFLSPPPWPMWPASLQIVLTFAFAAACGLGGMASGKIGLKRIERLNERAPKLRRCLKCGAKVGIAARKCWSCRSYLPPT